MVCLGYRFVRAYVGLIVAGGQITYLAHVVLAIRVERETAWSIWYRVGLREGIVGEGKEGKERSAEHCECRIRWSWSRPYLKVSVRGIHRQPFLYHRLLIMNRTEL